MGFICSKIEKQFKQAEFGLYSIFALFLQSQEPSANKSTIDLCLMFIEKYKKTLGEQLQANGKVPQYFVQLYCKVLNAKLKFAESLDYLKAHKSSFGMTLDYNSCMVTTLLKSNDLLGCINFLSTEVIRSNYENIEEY